MLCTKPYQPKHLVGHDVAVVVARRARLAQAAVLVLVLDHGPRRDEPLLLAALDVRLAIIIREAPLRALQDLLAARELELRAAEADDDVLAVRVLRAHAQDGLADGHARRALHGLAVRVAHARRQSIRASTGKHLVLPNHVERVRPRANVVRLLAAHLDEVLVARDARRLQSIGGDLLLLVGDQMGHEGELVDGRLFVAAVENADLRVRHAAAVPRLDVGLVLLEARAARGAAAHGCELSLCGAFVSSLRVDGVLPLARAVA
ncbi:unnamed protein product [Pelagomonas calceolata]|uniref:Uncharacterized protein n=1 Tax=Pelagomonas calceolata TaxID=35677 RepID=A0A8J2WZS3_9STRA|nr:unnamed protein product [Pelagomonas calceolata]